MLTNVASLPHLVPMLWTLLSLSVYADHGDWTSGNPRPEPEEVSPTASPSHVPTNYFERMAELNGVATPSAPTSKSQFLRSGYHFHDMRKTVVNSETDVHIVVVESCCCWLNSRLERKVH